MKDEEQTADSSFNSSVILPPSSFRLSFLFFHPDVRRHAGEARADLVKLYD